MSWLSGYKAKPSTSSAASETDLREAKRKKLEADRLVRAQQRAARQKQLQQVEQSRKEADEALRELCELADDIFEDEPGIDNDVSEDILEDFIMANFDQENEDDSATALDNLRSVQCPFNKGDIEFWFSQLEDQLTLIGVKKQWTKKIALTRFLPPEIQAEMKSLFKLQQTNAGTDIYFRIKKKILKAYGPKPEDAYIRAKNRVMTGKPSQLGKLIIEDICPGDVKLEGCHCANTVWGIFREGIPILIRNHIADMPFNKDTWEAVLDKADQVWDSNQGSEPLPPPSQVAAATADSSAVIAAVQRGQGNQKNKNKPNGQGGQKNKGQNSQGNKNQNNQTGQNNQNSNKTPKPAVNDDNLCKMHAKWKESANFCSAPWACRMKNIYKAPQ